MVVQTESPTATIWIDTNVMLEVFTFGDFFHYLAWGNAQRQLAEREGRTLPYAFAPAMERLVRTRNSLWMAMALCRERAVTQSYDHELFRNSLKIAPPGTRLGLPTKALFNAFMPHGIFNVWSMRLNGVGENLGNSARDRLIGDICRDENMMLISRDIRAMEYAATQGVLAEYPEHYAATVMCMEEARSEFLRRLHDSAICAADENLRAPMYPGWLISYLRDAIERYEGVWALGATG